MEDDDEKERKRKRQCEAQARWRARNPDKVKQANARHRLKNPDYQKEWAKKNPGKIKTYAAQSAAKPETKEYQKEWRQKNPDKYRAAQARYDVKDPPKERQRRYRLRHPVPKEVATEAKRLWREANWDRHKAVRKAWEKQNRELLLDYCAKRRSHTSGKLSSGLVLLLLEEQGSKCPYCWGSLSIDSFSMDHYMPLKLGGNHDDDNIQLTCGPCNSRKRDRHPAEFLEYILKAKRYDAEPSYSPGLALAD